MAITNLKINGVTTPLGYAPGALLLSWLVEESSAQAQSSATVRVWKTDDATPVWEHSGDLNWEGTPLDFVPAPCTRYTVSVSVEDSNGAIHVGETWFETGLLNEPWQAQWITPVDAKDYAPVMQGRFSTDGKVKSARLYMVGLGLYTAMLNGRSITNEVLAPGVWDYEEEVPYQTYDVTDFVTETNVLEVTLGNGWYKGRFGLEQAHPFGDKFALLAQLHVTYTDGHEQQFCTDENWRWYESDIVADNGIYDGETLDRLFHAEKEVCLHPVMLADVPLRITDRLTPPTVEAETLPVAEVITTPAGETVLDFGQNHVGWLRFRTTLPKGAQVHFDFGEVLQQGNFYNDNYRSAVGGFTYRSDGREEVVCQQFTFYGFRYVRVSGWVGELKAEDFESPVLHADMERTGCVSSGNELLNRLYENTLWGQKSNFLSIPTDCPQRDERLGWTGDAQVFASTACYNMDCRAFYRSFLSFLRLEQQRHEGAVPTYVPSMGDFKACAIWSDAATLISRTLLRFSGVVEEATQHYDLMKDWVDYVTKCNGGALYTEGFQLGDWLAQDGITPQSF